MPRLGERDAGNPHRHLDVLHGLELGQQVMELEDEPDVPVAKLHERGVVHLRQRLSRHHDRARAGTIEAAQQVQQRALADARRADDGHHLPRLHVEIEIAQHVNALRCRPDSVLFSARTLTKDMEAATRTAAPAPDRAATPAATG